LWIVAANSFRRECQVREHIFQHQKFTNCIATRHCHGQVDGVCRVIWGGKGWTFYEMNPFFWAKILTFGLIAAASIIPTLRFIAWRRARKADPAFQPEPADVARVRRWLGIEALLLLPLLAFAAAMARWPF